MAKLKIFEMQSQMIQINMNFITQICIVRSLNWVFQLNIWPRHSIDRMSDHFFKVEPHYVLDFRRPSSLLLFD